MLAYRGRGRDQEFGVQPLELRPKDHSAAEGDGRGRGGACQEMAAVAVYGAKRSMRAELKQRLRALSSEERLRQSHLLTQKVREDCRELNSGKVGLACLRRRTSTGRLRVLLGARAAVRGGLWVAPELLRGLRPGQVCAFNPSYLAIARKGITVSFSRCRDCRSTPTLSGLNVIHSHVLNT